MSLPLLGVGVPTDRVASEPADSANELRRVYQQFHDLVFRLGLRYGAGHVHWAEDLTHDVFMKLFANPDALADIDNMAGWLYRAATNASLNRLRRERFLKSPAVQWLLFSSAPQVPDPEGSQITDQRLRRILCEVDAMPPKQRACFYMYYVDGKTQQEIGEILGHSKSYVCKLLGRLRNRAERVDAELER